MPEEKKTLGEMQISLKDMLLKILLSWRAILIWMLVGAVLLGGVGAFRSYRQRQQALQAQGSENKQESISTLRDALTEPEAEEVEETWKLYQGFRQDYEDLLEYQENSLKMQLDPMEVTTGTIWYRVDNHYQVEYPVMEADNNLPDIVYSYLLALQASSLYESMVDTLNWDTTASYLQELVRVEAGEQEGFFTVSVIAEDAASGEQLLGLLAEAVEASTPELQQLYGAYDLVELDRQVSQGTDLELLKEQQAQRTSLNSAAGQYRNLSSYMTEDQEAYYLDLQADAAADTQEDGALEGTSSVTVPAFQPVQVKYVVLGVLVGGFLACAWAAVRYLFSSRLRLAEDLEINYRVPVLGIFPGQSGKKKAMGGVDRWFLSLFGRKEGALSQETLVQLVVAQVKAAAAKSGIQTVYLTGTGRSAAGKELQTYLCQALQKEGIGAEEGNSILQDAQSLEQMAQSDGVILVEAVNASRYGEVQEEVALCRRYQAAVLGSVVLQ